NEASATVSVCPSTRPTGVEWIDGFESGRIIGSHGESVFFTGANTAQVSADTITPRYGAYSLKVAANGVATYIESLLPVENATGKWYAFYLGTLSAATYTANYDDVVVSSAGADYPLGDGKVLILRPNAMGTNNTATDFQNDDATAINSTSYTRLDETPMNNSS